MEHFDLIVIGSGPAGEKGAAQAAYFNKKVALIERNPENKRPWHRSLCDTCPVPGILRNTTCKHLVRPVGTGFRLPAALL